MTGERHPRILIADDDANIRRMLTVWLRKHGYRTSDARDGGEALAAMREGEVDLVVLDLRMPKVTGWDVLKKRAAAPELLKIPVIVVTAERGIAAEKILGDGICALLPKPFDPATLQALVKSCLIRAEKQSADDARPTVGDASH